MQVEVGAVVEGTVTGITKFGAFVSLPDGRSGLVHISEIANTYVNDVNEFLKLGDKVKVRVLDVTAGQVSGPSGDAAFEDRLKQFMQESDSRMAGNRLYSDRTRGRRRGSGRG